MLYRRFGRTDLQMPIFSCGGMRFIHSWNTDCTLDEVPPESQANVEATVRRALELGINHIETSRGYGTSERQLGLVLPKLSRERMIVQTKVVPSADAGEFLDQCRDSIDRLQLDHVDLLAIHGINNHELLWWSIRPGGCLAAARKLVEEGRARHVGFSTHGSPEVIRIAIDHEGDGGFDYMNLHWYYIHQENAGVIKAAADADMGVFIISPSDKGGMLYKPSPKLIELCEPLHPMVFNCLFCLSNPDVHTLSIGAAKPEDFDLQLATIPLLDRADELLVPIMDRLRAAMAEVVGADVARRYAEGLPSWDMTPGLMNIRSILWLRGLALAYDMREFAENRYNLLGNGAHWFPGMNAAGVDDFDLDKALEKSPFKEQIPDWLRETHAMLHKGPQKLLSESD